jgi:hypothetical protein
MKWHARAETTWASNLLTEMMNFASTMKNATFKKIASKKENRPLERKKRKLE